MFLEDEAAEEEEEGAQAGLGDFGFGVTSNIREHDEEMVSTAAVCVCACRCVDGGCVAVSVWPPLCMKRLFLVGSSAGLHSNSILLNVAAAAVTPLSLSELRIWLPLQLLRLIRSLYYHYHRLRAYFHQQLPHQLCQRSRENNNSCEWLPCYCVTYLARYGNCSA
jgi:hypothetical protein